MNIGPVYYIVMEDGPFLKPVGRWCNWVHKVVEPLEVTVISFNGELLTDQAVFELSREVDDG